MPTWYTAMRKGPDGTVWLWCPYRAKWKPVSCCGATHEPLSDDSPPTAEEQTEEHMHRMLHPWEYR